MEGCAPCLVHGTKKDVLPLLVTLALAGDAVEPLPLPSASKSEEVIPKDLPACSTFFLFVIFINCFKSFLYKFRTRFRTKLNIMSRESSQMVFQSCNPFCHLAPTQFAC